ncbi:hypothetical protein Ana3638_04530 [Anaerocolumna sedimenticola]|uniref:LNS2/PITP domain-containing protein n=1 Tax=Anaerocolumna sedimenticola TaxID=2696063 RepID=A0A6P1TIL2_9FIRM|nr:hypothetical protein [Anaerocolumna sedimenticola]QHQ60137.1 hypothetical protein Ana3638_04530 [Anaerocolumna sedimenticola]
MYSVLVFIDGTICDQRNRIQFVDTPYFNSEDNILSDLPTGGSLKCMTELSSKYKLIYIGARPDSYVDITRKWLKKVGFPEGEVYLGENQEERMKIVLELKDKNDFIAGIGDRWDDNELHLAIGCKSIILKEWEPNWDTVRKYI